MTQTTETEQADIYAVNPVFDGVDSSAIRVRTSMVDVVKDVMDILSHASTEDYWGVVIHFNPGKPDAIFFDWEIDHEKDVSSTVSN